MGGDEVYKLLFLVYRVCTDYRSHVLDPLDVELKMPCEWMLEINPGSSGSNQCS